jgi:hypothetical protein
MTSLLVIDVPQVASWQRTRLGARGHYKSSEAKARERVIAQAALAVRPRGWSLDGLFAVSIVYHPADQRARDCDRVGSLVLDALTGVLWRDDSDRFVKTAPPIRADDDGTAYVMRWTTPEGHLQTFPRLSRVALAPGLTRIIVERIGEARPLARKRKGAA